MSDDPVGFFWSTKLGYSCVILHKARKIKSGRKKITFCRAFWAETPTELIRLCREGHEGLGYEIGSAKKVKELCDSAPTSRLTRPRRSKIKEGK